MLVIFLILLFFTNPIEAAEIIDLGKKGSVCPYKEQTPVPSSTNISKITYETVNHLPSYHLENNNKQGLGEYTFDLEGDSLLKNTKIFIFSANDPDSLNAALTVKADYGICVDYKGIEDIKEFREKSGVTFPIQMANQEIIDFLKIKHYPSMVIINGKEIIVQSFN